MKNGLIPHYSFVSKESLCSDLEECNNRTKEFGLMLTYDQLIRIQEVRVNSLRDMGRVEFGEGVITKIIFAFCDSPYIDQDNYEETICELQEIFYYFKNETLESVSDDCIISYMKDKYDTVCHGSLKHLSSTVLEEFSEQVRYENE